MDFPSDQVRDGGQCSSWPQSVAPVRCTPSAVSAPATSAASKWRPVSPRFSTVAQPDAYTAERTVRDEQPGKVDKRRHDRFADLYRQNHEDLYDFVVRQYTDVDPDDIVATVFEIAWQKLENIEGDAAPWLYGVTRNVIRNRSRSQARYDRLVEALSHFTPADTTDAFNGKVTYEDAELLTKAFNRLSPDDQEILTFAAWEGLRGAELGVVIGTTAPVASLKLHRARRRFRTLYESSRREP